MGRPRLNGLCLMLNKWYIPLGVLLVLLPACRSDREKEAEEVVEEVPETRMTEPLFHAGFEGMEDASKVYMDGEYRILWDAGDEISIFTKTTQNRRYGFLGATGDGEGDFEAVTAADGTSPAQARNVAVYPYQASAACDTDGRLTLDYPAAQTYREGTYGPGAHVMVATSDDDHLSFRNVGCGLGFKFYGDGVSVSSITLTGRGGEDLAGTVYVTPGDAPALEFAASGTEKAITLTAASPVALGADAEHATLFWFSLPPLTLSEGFTVSVSTADGKVFERSVKSSFTLARNYVYRMAALEVVPVPASAPTELGVYWNYRAGVSPYVYNPGKDMISVYEAEGKAYVRFLVPETTHLYEVGPIPTDAEAGDVLSATFTESEAGTVIRTPSVSLTVLSRVGDRLTLETENHSYFVLRF